MGDGIESRWVGRVYGAEGAGSLDTKNETANLVVQQHGRKIPEDGHINARNLSSL